MRLFLGGCKVEIGFLFVAVITFSLLIDRTGVAGVGLLATAIHEGGHLVMMNLYSIPPEKIKMNPFGIDIVEKRGSRHSYQSDMAIALAGPCANLLFAGICIWGSLWIFSDYLFNLGIANLLLAALNILPVEPLDGGQALFSFLCPRFGTERSIRLVEFISFCVVLPLGIMGFLVLLRSRYNFSLLLVSVYLTLLLVLKKGRWM